MKRRTIILWGAAAVAVLIQLVPLDRDNPPVERDFDGPAAVREVLVRSCYDCHSHQTTWPWYSRVAPVSFLVVHDVQEGREHLNFSAWRGDPRQEAEILEVLTKGEMPLPIYLLMHPGAKLSGPDLALLQRHFGGAPGR